MRREDISAALGGIDQQYIEEAAEEEGLCPHRQTHRPRGLAALAACLALVLTIGLWQGNRLAAPASGAGEPGDMPTAEGAVPTERSMILRIEGWEGDYLRCTVVDPLEEIDYPEGTEVQIQLGEEMMSGHTPDVDPSYHGQAEAERENLTTGVTIQVWFRPALDGVDTMLYGEQIQILP